MSADAVAFAPERTRRERGLGLALFDLDHTLLPFDSDHAWNEFMVAEGWVAADVFRAANERFYADYQAGRLDIAAYVAFAMTPLVARDPAEVRAALARYVEQAIHPAVRPAAVELVAGHRSRGDDVVLVSATHALVVKPVAALFGFAPDEVVSTELEFDPLGRPTGRIAGTPSFREGKVERIGQWLAARGRSLADYARISAYSDSPNDLPMLELATDAVATHPSPALLATARERGWRVLDLFGDTRFTSP